MADPASPAAGLAPLLVPPPALRAGDVLAALREDYGLEGSLAPLVSERDQNFRLTTPDGHDFVVKIANPGEPAADTDFQVRALLHTEAAGCRVALPRVVRTLAGETVSRVPGGRRGHVLRVVTWVPGRPAADVRPTPGLARDMGASLAALDAALQGFRHPGEARTLIWDIQRAAELRQLLGHITVGRLAGRVAAVVDDFEARVLPRMDGLRHQVIHGDYHTDNVLVDSGGKRVRGIIDFGDMLYAPLVADVAIAASYQRTTATDPLVLLAPFIAGYHAGLPLLEQEIELLYDLVRARLATTITVLCWRQAVRAGDDGYLQAALDSENSAPHFLEAIEALGRARFTAGARAACEPGQAGDRKNNKNN